MPTYQKAEQASDLNQPPVGPSAKDNNREALNSEVLAKFVEAATRVGYSKGVEDLAERLIARLATRAEAPESTAFRQKEAELVRSYDVLRQELAGPADANALVDANIRAVIPPSGREGDEIQIWVENAGQPARVAFAGAAGETVAVTPKKVDPLKVGVGKIMRVWVDVPRGAVTGPITVITDRGEPTSRKDFVVGPEVAVPVALEHLSAGSKREWPP